MATDSQSRFVARQQINSREAGFLKVCNAFPQSIWWRTNQINKRVRAVKLRRNNLMGMTSGEDAPFFRKWTSGLRSSTTNK
jgi:hypothetical protein